MGKGGNKASLPAGEKLEVLVDDVYYDVTEYSKKHPGGSVMGFYAGKDIDATQAFMNFHLRSKKAKSIMKSLPQRKADVKVN